MSFTDRFNNRVGSRVDPPTDAFPITPDDDEYIQEVTRSIVLGSEGSVRVLTLAGTDITYPLLAAGISHPMRVYKVFETGTTATGIIGQV